MNCHFPANSLAELWSGVVLKSPALLGFFSFFLPHKQVQHLLSCPAHGKKDREWRRGHFVQKLSQSCVLFFVWQNLAAGTCTPGEADVVTQKQYPTSCLGRRAWKRRWHWRNMLNCSLQWRYFPLGFAKRKWALLTPLCSPKESCFVLLI